ncbi:MAG: glycosyltransferase family 4 protein [Lachnospiraceae bacterium]|nr:glycosyltransferase family 4 protein [Lachnospiraceae bacterium]
MKILIISHEYPPIGGGGANACFFLAREFMRIGHSVTVLTAGLGGRQDEETTASGAVIKKVKCKRKSEASSSFAEMLSFLVSAWKQAGKLVRKNNYDFCIAFFGIPSGPLALYLKKRYKLPYLIRSGGGDIPGAQKRFAAVYKVIAPILRKVWKESEGIVANSEGLKKRAAQFEDRYPIYVVENGVDSEFFHPDVSKRYANCINILFVSRLIEGKGLQFVIPKIMDIQRAVFERTGRSICLTVVGDGPYKEDLERLVSEFKCSELVKFVGKKDKEHTADIYQAADLFILPSLSEGMPNVVLEAMSSGLPIIMTPCEGSGELVTDNGYISDIDGFADKIIDLCVNNELRYKMGENSVNAVKERFNWHRTAEAYIRLIQKA